ncbi:MAG: Asp-tRNA(Asn)/Glu-tRNA(Gln) amidotransferase subunit GatB [Candidatus Omnitrophota bacterium]
MEKYETVIGLEVHVQLLTETKVFCGCSTKFGLLPNSSTCPVCLGLPGSLPVLNEKAFIYAIKTALALNCTIQDTIKFDRKNYYYPDLPKNFQISQYDKPLAYNGFLEIGKGDQKKKIGITRAHMEEDAGKLIHEPEKGFSLVDLNRAGTPLLEIVSEPDIRSPEDAVLYLQNLKAILKYLKVSDCNMEEGSLRCDANVSLRRVGEKKLGVKTELKNMNSFKAVRDALFYEVNRQSEALDNNEVIRQETRLWDENQKRTLVMRTKEESHDYRYFPEPDLVPFTVDKKEIAEIRRLLPELPQAKKERLIKEYSLNENDADILTREVETCEFFEKTASLVKDPKDAANWITGDIASYLKNTGQAINRSKLTYVYLADIINLIYSGEITGKIAKEILREVFTRGLAPKALVDKLDLRQMTDDGALEAAIDKVLAENSKSVNDYKSGKKNAITYLIGQIMKETKGKANPQKVNEAIKRKLD